MKDWAAWNRFWNLQQNLKILQQTRHAPCIHTDSFYLWFKCVIVDKQAQSSKPVFFFVWWHNGPISTVWMKLSFLFPSTVYLIPQRCIPALQFSLTMHNYTQTSRFSFFFEWVETHLEAAWRSSRHQRARQETSCRSCVHQVRPRDRHSNQDGVIG